MSTRQPGRSTRDRILDAAQRLMREIGLARVTTKAIALAVGCSEAALYKHFASKEELFIAVLRERLPPLGSLLTELTEDPGDRSAEQCLVDVVREAAAFYEVSVSITASLFAEPALLQRHRAGIRALGMGPQIPSEQVADYLRAEQRRGRVGEETDPKAVADALVGACLHRAFLAHFWGEEPAPSLDDFAAGLVRAVVDGISL